MLSDYHNIIQIDEPLLRNSKKNNAKVDWKKKKKSRKKKPININYNLVFPALPSPYAIVNKLNISYSSVNKGFEIPLIPFFLQEFGPMSFF